MRLYICIDGSYAGTQADARAKGRGFTQEEVPTDKAGLIDYLNALVDEHRSPASEPQERVSNASPVNMAATAADLSAARKTAFTAAEIEEFILDRATVAQVERIFAAIGTRFAESR